MNSKVSNCCVIITTYNDEYSDLSRAVESVINQKVLPEQIIVVDDGSSNNTSDLVADNLFKLSSSPIFLLKKENGGPSSARNYGLKYCTSDFVTFLDSDDVMLEDNIEKKDLAMKTLSLDYFGVYGTHVKENGEFQQYGRFDGVLNPDLIGRKNGFPGGVHTYLFRLKNLIDVGGFDETLVNNEDYDLVIRLIKKKLKAKGGGGPGFIKTNREGSLSRSNDYLKVYNNVRLFLDKAEKNNYFSNAELNRRKAGIELWLARQIVKASGERFESFKHFRVAFYYIRRAGFKQYFKYFLLRFGVALN
ncbi:glycosyltransferase family A protein [Denitrificimonas caeni]|uniref:glycosyltransferase family A protein n=1 Tax=Denitrificimonas caeni TaxID=521720 RepID=UPI001964588E|nr:glycosyltransferase family A protein [Denitrificimonas caeni]